MKKRAPEVEADKKKLAELSDRLKKATHAVEKAVKSQHQAGLTVKAILKHMKRLNKRHGAHHKRAAKKAKKVEEEIGKNKKKPRTTTVKVRNEAYGALA